MEKKNIYSILAVVLLVIAGYMFCGNGTSIHAILDRIDGITANNERAGAAVDSAKHNVGDVGNELGAVSDRVGDYAKSAYCIASQIADSREITQRSIELNRRAKQILEDIEQRNKEPAKEIKDKPG